MSAERGTLVPLGLTDTGAVFYAVFSHLLVVGQTDRARGQSSGRLSWASSGCWWDPVRRVGCVSTASIRNVPNSRRALRVRTRRFRS